MQLNIQSPFKTLNKAYLKEKVSRNNVELFKTELTALFNKAATGYSEDTLKDFITEFLRNTWYNPHHSITINKERKDLSIHTGKTAADAVSVIAEIKKTGSAEMIADGKLNVKAFHELVLYYLQERITIGNNEIKYLLATDVNNWILIDANEFDKKIYGHTKIKRLYDTYINDKKDNPFFYDELKKIIEETDDTITCTQFNLNSFKKYVTNADKADDEKLIPLYKILSPTHLLKLPFANDSNSLDKNFYTELLHLIGLEEIKDGSKKLIQRKKESSEASLLENAIAKLKDKESLRDVPDVTKFGFTNEEQYYNIALELCITWINRILFLKLLEAQLFNYHQKNNEYLFLNDAFIHDFDELNNLFLQVLAEKPENRRERLKNKFSKVPYLNSSLFERTELERKTIDISALDNNLPLPLDKNTVLKDNTKRKQGSLPTLSYLFTFLNSYDFASEGKAEIQEENKNLINASVLGLIFEKINGYKDGSFFTPGFITMYMCRETLRRAVVQKFNDANNWPCKTFEDLQETIEYADKEKRQQANNIINSITICDPAVGSGHFLVSALNELISIKHDLKILQYHHNGQRINHKEYKVEIENDELIIQDIETEDFFKYTLNQKGNIKPELQYLQETLFHEKETLIENCLFGVDINANSVKICRLRLWIELLKNAYYTKATNYTQLETLPNIDINIKQGNSLISRFALDEDLSTTLKKSKWTIDSYKLAVQTYRNAQSKEEKRQMEELIDKIKNDFETTVSWNNPINKKLSKLRGELALLQRPDLFSADAKKKTKANTELEKLSAAINKLDKEKDEIQSSAIYKEAFEWRFEFPEVLDSEGKFLGFDVVIGNPPYGAAINKQEDIFYRTRFQVSNYQIDTYTLFTELGINIGSKKSLLFFIIPTAWYASTYDIKFREYLIKEDILNGITICPKSTFDEAIVETCIIECEKFFKNIEINVFALNREIINQVSKANIDASTRYNINIFSSNAEDKFFNRIKNKCSIVNDSFDVIWGIKVYEKGKGIPPQISEDSKTKKFHSKNKLSDTYKPLIGGSEIFPYSLTWKEGYINYGKWIAAPRTPDWFEAIPRIVVREVTAKGKIYATIITEEIVFSNSVDGIRSKNNDTSELKILLGILNSKFASYLHLKSSANSQKDSFPKVLLQDLREFPFPKIKDNSQLPFITLVDKILAAKKENPKADTSTWEKEIDELVYALYGLTEEEIKMVEGII
jgi:adenine-specific DNA-methyltransferase